MGRSCGHCSHCSFWKMESTTDRAKEGHASRRWAGPVCSFWSHTAQPKQEPDRDQIRTLPHTPKFLELPIPIAKCSCAVDHKEGAYGAYSWDWAIREGPTAASVCGMLGHNHLSYPISCATTGFGGVGSPHLAWLSRGPLICETKC